MVKYSHYRSQFIILSTASICWPQAYPLSHSLFLTCSPSCSPFSFALRYGWDHNYVLTHGVSPYNAPDSNSKWELSVRQPSLLLIGGEGQEARPQTRVAVLMRLCLYRKSELWQEETVTGLLKRAADISKPAVFGSERGKPLHSSLYRWKQAIKTEMSNLKTSPAAIPAWVHCQYILIRGGKAADRIIIAEWNTY